MNLIVCNFESIESPLHGIAGKVSDRINSAFYFSETSRFRSLLHTFVRFHFCNGIKQKEHTPSAV